MFQNLNFVNRIFLLFLLLIFLVLVSFVGVSTYRDYSHFKKENAYLEEYYLNTQKELVRVQTNNAIDLINHEKSRTETRLKAILKEQVRMAHDMAMHLYETYKDSRSLPEIKKMVREALRTVRFFDGRGYYFAVSLDGVTELNGYFPEREGGRVLDSQDSEGTFFVRDMITLAEQEGEGWYEYRFLKPGAEGNDFRKVSYVKRFEPFGWFIGSGEYVDNMEQDIQKEVLAQLASMRFGKDGYVFAGQWDGLSLSGPGTGKNMLHVQDVNGVRIVQEIIAAAKEDGGFVRYVLPAFEGKRPLAKISYARGVPQWEWYVGAGVYLADVAELVRETTEEHKALLIRNTTQFLAMFLVLALIAVIVSRKYSKRLQAEFDSFEGFFRHAASELEPLDLKPLKTREFRELGQAANHMVRELKQAREQIEKSLGEKEILLREIHHRVKNNMQILSSLLYLQSEYTEDSEAAGLLMESRNRIHSMSLVHDELYQSGDFSLVDFKDYVEKLTPGLLHSLNADERITPVLHTEKVDLPIQQAIPCGLIINELVTNAVKHAFPAGVSGRVEVTVVRGGDMVTLSVRDDGVGLPPDIDVEDTTSLGLHLVVNLVRQVRGTLDVARNQGTAFTINFKAGE